MEIIANINDFFIVPWCLQSLLDVDAGGLERTNLRNEREGVELGTGDAHEVGVLLAGELGISEEFVLRMVEAFFHFDKVSVTFEST